MAARISFEGMKLFFLKLLIKSKMKKFFTLLAAAVVGVSGAMAAQFSVPQGTACKKIQTQLSEKAVKLMQERISNAELLGQGNGIRKSASWQGEEWNAYITNLGEDFFLQYFGGDEESAKFLKNWTCAIFQFENMTKGNTSLIFLSFWPKNGILMGGEGFGVPDDADPEEPYDIQLFIESGLTLKVLDEYGMGFSSPDGMQVEALGILNVNSKNPGSTKPWWEEFGLYPSAWNGTPCAPKAGAEISWLAYEKETGYLELSLEGDLVGSAGNNVAPFMINYEGTGYVDGFEPITKTVEGKEMHIVNTGEWSYEYCADNDIYTYDVEWGPLQRYYLLFCSEGLVFPLESFTKTEYPTKVYGDPENPTDTYSYLMGALYSAPGASPEDAAWTIRELEPVETNPGVFEVPVAPEAGDAVYGGYNPEVVAYSGVDGIHCAFEGYNCTLKDGSKIYTGTPDGFFTDAYDQYRDHVVFTFKGDIFYHNDPSDFSVYKMIPAIGEGTGVESVDAANDAVVAYYDLNGRRVMNPEKGIFIARTASGKALKVVK